MAASRSVMTLSPSRRLVCGTSPLRTGTWTSRSGPVARKGSRILARGATEETAFGITLRIASLEDIVRSKQAADRDKDRLVLPTLREILANRDLDEN